MNQGLNYATEVNRNQFMSTYHMLNKVVVYVQRMSGKIILDTTANLSLFTYKYDTFGIYNYITQKPRNIKT